MKELKELQDILVQHKNALKRKYNVKEIAIFGSFVRGQQKKTSDIDILVEFGKPIGFFKFLELEEHLSKLLGAKVDLVSKKALKPYIGQHILKEMVSV